jgi:hypothetical protein
VSDKLKETKCAIVRALLKHFWQIAGVLVPRVVMKSAIVSEGGDAKSIIGNGWRGCIYWARPNCAIARKPHA